MEYEKINRRTDIECWLKTKPKIVGRETFRVYSDYFDWCLDVLVEPLTKQQLSQELKRTENIVVTSTHIADKGVVRIFTLNESCGKKL